LSELSWVQSVPTFRRSDGEVSCTTLLVHNCLETVLNCLMRVRSVLVPKCPVPFSSTSQKIPDSSRLLAPPSGSPKCLRIVRWLTLCTLNTHLLTYSLIICGVWTGGGPESKGSAYLGSANVNTGCPGRGSGLVCLSRS